MEALESSLQHFSAALQLAAEQLPGLPDTAARGVEGRWSRKEILGHLIDSAANNHQRFVRGQLTRDLSTPGYEQEKWVDAQRYQDREWKDLVELWLAYNRHLLHVMSNTAKEHLDATIRIANYDPATLEFVMTDYVSHLKHHLKQIGLPVA
jgi:hypothetical protein